MFQIHALNSTRYLCFFLLSKGAARLLGYQLCLNKQDVHQEFCQQLGRLCQPHPTYGKQEKLLLYSVQIIDSLKTTSFKQPSQTAIILQDTKPTVLQTKRVHFQKF